MSWFSLPQKRRHESEKTKARIEPTEFIYEWRGKPRRGRYDRKYRPYMAINAIRDTSNPRLLEIASNRGDRAREIVERNIFSGYSCAPLDPWYQEARVIWDELLPFNSSRYTHLLECGIKYDNIEARSHFLKTPMALNHERLDADFCAFEVARFLTDVLNDDYHDFDGAALEMQQMWIFKCIFAKWKSLRSR